MKRLVITGLPCPPEVWESFLGPHKSQKIVSIFEVLENSPSSDLRIMSRYVSNLIETYRPQSIIAHDLGVPLTLLGLLSLKKRKVALSPRITFFNGAFRRFNVLRAHQAFRIQVMSSKGAIAEVERQGGIVDHRLKKHYSKIRAVFRYIILYGLAEAIYDRLGMEDLLGDPKRFGIKFPVQIIASKNDPFIPFSAIEQLRKDTSALRFIEVPYGHFPYSIPPKHIRKLLSDWEDLGVQKLYRRESPSRRSSPRQYSSLH